jgi:hypothetical protein
MAKLTDFHRQQWCTPQRKWAQWVWWADMLGVVKKLHWQIRSSNCDFLWVYHSINSPKYMMGGSGVGVRQVQIG